MKKIIITEGQLSYIEKREKHIPLLEDVYPDTTNRSNIVPLRETNARRLISRHAQKGFACISACRGLNEFGLEDTKAGRNELARINNERTRQLIDDIRKAGFSYTLSYGGFIENKGEADEESVYERSAIVYATKRDGKDYPQELFDFAVEECRKFNQDAVLVQMPNEKPRYIKQDGTTDFEFSGDLSFNDLSQEYFTDLHKNTHGKIKDGSKPTRYSYTEAYIAPKPQNFVEAHIRHLKGEVFTKI